MKLLDNAVIRDRYDVIVVGAGIGGLTAAALLAKRDLRVLLIEQHFLPGGCVSHVRRHGISMDVGAAMLFGFGERGYNPHRFVMNELEEEIDMIPHESIYRLHIHGKEVTFWRDFEKYMSELAQVFPNQEKELRKFYGDLFKIYDAMVLKNKMPMPPTEMPKIEGLKMFLRNPFGTMNLGVMLFKSCEYLINKYITDPRAAMYFDVLTGTFGCVNISECPAAIAGALFCDIHEGGAYYPSGDPQMLPNKMERAIERYGGQIIYRHLVEEILVFKGRAYGVRLDDGTEILADKIVSNSTIWNLYGKLVKPRHISAKRMKWAQAHVPTFSSLLLFIGVKESAIPKGTRPIELFIEDPNDFGGENFAVYIPSMDDPSICPPGTHSLTVIAPNREQWPRPDDPEYRTEEYKKRKEEAANRIVEKMERAYFPGLREHIITIDIGTPSTIERYTLKNWGNVGGPKQMMGQELMKRLHARSEWKNLYVCGDSTIMGEGVVASASSGVGAANMVLRDLGIKEFLPRKFKKEYVNLIKGKPWTPVPDASEPITVESAIRLAQECQHCEEAVCRDKCPAGIDVLNFARRMEAGNFAGAVRAMREVNPLAEICGYICPAERLCQKDCKRLEFSHEPVRIASLQAWVCGHVSKLEGWERYSPERNGHRIAVVGSGPAGLTCAHYLARLGYIIDVYEKAQKAGGMLALTIPEFRLPAEIVHREVEGVSFPGITFHYGKELGEDFSIQDLLNGHRAVFLAPGLWSGRKLDIPGSGNADITDALSFLKMFRERGMVEVRARVLVIGGGSVAADAALAAKKSGAKKVSMVCLEKEIEMPALPDEVAELKKQGIDIFNCWGPRAFLTANKLSLIICRSVFDAQGKFCPTFDDSQSTEIEFDQVIIAVGQMVESSLAGYLDKEFGRSDGIEVDGESLRVKGQPNTYAGGDIIRGAGTVVQAVADGRKAAMAIAAQVAGTR